MHTLFIDFILKEETYKSFYYSEGVILFGERNKDLQKVLSWAKKNNFTHIKQKGLKKCVIV